MSHSLTPACNKAPHSQSLVHSTHTAPQLDEVEQTHRLRWEQFDGNKIINVMKRKITRRKINKPKKNNECKLEAIVYHSPTDGQPGAEQQAPGQLCLQFIC